MPRESIRPFRGFPSHLDKQGVRVCSVNPDCLFFNGTVCHRSLTKCPEISKDRRPIEDRKSEISEEDFLHF